MNNNIKIGCETYTWQMAGEQYKGRLEHIMGISQQAGFQGIEPETSFIQHLSDPVRMQEELDKYQQELAVLCLVEDWLHPQETEEEIAHANQWIDFLQYFPDTLFLLVQMPGKDRAQLEERQQNFIRCIHQVASRATARGIRCSFHPNSPMGSICRTKEDYEKILNALNPSLVGYTPDVGHIAKGDMDPLTILRQYRSSINCVHYKDMYPDGSWAPMGAGCIDFEGITTYLKDSDFQGWIIMEDECDQAITDPDAVTLADGQYLEEKMRSYLI